MNLKQLEKIMQLMRQYELHSLAVSDAETNIKLTRGRDPLVGLAAAEAPAARAQIVLPKDPSFSPAISPGSTSGQLKEIKSPFVGTYYSAASPGADPFVYVGKKVKKGEVLCIIEAMKLMNEIEAERDATIVEILVANEEPIEYDQTLFRFE